MRIILKIVIANWFKNIYCILLYRIKQYNYIELDNIKIDMNIHYFAILIKNIILLIKMKRIIEFNVIDRMRLLVFLTFINIKIYFYKIKLLFSRFYCCFRNNNNASKEIYSGIIYIYNHMINGFK